MTILICVRLLMMNKDTYKRELVRMWNTLRDDEYKTYNACNGVSCNKCPLHGIECSEPLSSYEVVEIVKKWSKEHQQKKYQVSRLEYDILKHLSDNTALMYITRNVYGNVYLFNEEPRKVSGNWYGNGARSMSVLDELFQFVKCEDEEPTSIQDVLKNCEVMNDDTDKR